MDSQIVPGGFLLKYYAARHTLGHYRSFGGTGVYTFPPSILTSPTRFTQILQYALSKVISRHPTLSFGVIPQSERLDAHFYRLTSINFSDVVSFHPSSAPAGQEDSALEKELGLAHRHLWTEQTQKPGWEIIIIHHENGDGRVDIIFITHHALADGGSGASFHKSLYSYLSEALSLPSPTSEWPHQVSPTTKLPISIEDAFPFPSTANLPTQPQVPESEGGDGGQSWAALPPSLPVKDLALLLTIPSSDVSKALSFCRSIGITLTSLLHALILLCLSQNLPSSLAPSFKAGTPYSLRKFSGISDEEMVNHISNINTHFAPPLISLLRELNPEDEGSDKERETMKKIGQQFQGEVRGEMEFIEKEKYSPPLYAQSHFCNSLSDPLAIQAYHESAIRKKRECAYEISNIGLVKIPAAPQGEANPGKETQGKETQQQIKFENLIFSQCAMLCGPAIGCSVASLANGPLTICFSYQEGILSSDFMKGLRDYVGRRLGGFGA